jgi:hypothetical protein
MEIDDLWLVEIRSDGGRVTPQERGHCDAKIKRLEKGTFRFPAASEAEATSVIVTATDLIMLLDGVDLQSVKRRPRYVRDPASPADFSGLAP